MTPLRLLLEMKQTMDMTTPGRSGDGACVNLMGVLVLAVAWTCFWTAPAQAIEVVDLNGGRQAVTDLEIRPGWQVTAKEGRNDVTFTGENLSKIQISENPPRVPGPNSQVLIGTDEVLYCSIVGSDVDTLSVQSPILGGAKLSISTVKGAILAREVGESQIAALRQLIRKSAGVGDTVRLENGDVVQGTLLEIQQKQVLFERDGAELRLDRDLVQAVAFDPSLFNYDVGDALYAQVSLRDGSVLNVRDAQTVDNALKMTLVSGAELTAPISELVDLSFRNGRIVYLSDLEPSETAIEPYLDNPTPPKMNASVTGTPLRLTGKTFSKGIGVRSRTRLQYDLTDTFERFQAVVGLDASAGPQASVRFAVLVDGEEKFDSGLMTPASEPKAVDVPLGDARRLELLVDFGERGDVDDNANWCEARLLR